ncbi:hypothetical protein KPL70_001805 [Citrus sinensis]|nr:hypothetical protein KPL70_001805 [Citrus sinensis]
MDQKLMSGVCFNSGEFGIGSTSQRKVLWSILGANSIVQVGNDDNVSCLGFVDGGAPRTSIVIGGYQLENNLLQFDLASSRLGFSNSLLLRRTFCSNFKFTSI